jgi:predicted alpha/beta-fold hydrolase
VVCGFGTADNYYRTASSAPLVEHIRVPTLIVASRDDPMIPPDALARVAAPADVEIRLVDHGGHLGFVGRAGVDADRRWMDWRVVDWVVAQGTRRPISVDGAALVEREVSKR